MKNWEKPQKINEPTTTTKKAYRFLCYLISSWFYSGYCPIASATAGSLATLPLAFCIAYFYGFIGIFTSTIIIFAIGIITSKEVLKYTEHDPAVIVIDETAGQLLTFVFVANLLKNNLHAWPAYIIGFFLFRFFDILKPQPAEWADTKLISAWGVMLDDLFAGVYSGIVLYLINIYIKII